MSLLIGMAVVTLIFNRGNPEALGAIIPIGIVGLIHLIGVPAPMLNAVRNGNTGTWLDAFDYFVDFVIALLRFSLPDVPESR